MNPNVTTAFDPLLVALSFGFAVIGSIVALTAAGRVNQRGGRQSLSNIVTVGVALGGIGVWSMHCTGMFAAEFVCTTESRNAIPQDTGYISSFRLPTLVIAITLMMTAVLSVDQLSQYLRSKPARAAVRPS